MAVRRRLRGTTRRGRVKIYSKKQIRFLESKKLPYTRITKSGRRVRRNVR